MVWMLWLACGADVAGPGIVSDGGDPEPVGELRYWDITVLLDDPIGISGGLDPRAVRAVVLRAMNQVRDCYQREIPTLDVAGTVEVHVDVAADGRAAEVRTTPSAPALAAFADCAQGRFERLAWSTGPATLTVGLTADPGPPLPLRPREDHPLGTLGGLQVRAGQVDSDAAEALIEASQLAVRLCAWMRVGSTTPFPPPPAGHLALKLALGQDDLRFGTRIWAEDDTVGDPALSACVRGRIRELPWREVHAGPAEVGLRVVYPG